MKNINIQHDSTYFIDTNIWLYSFIRSQNREKTKIAGDIIKKCEIVISVQIINEVCVNLIKKVDFSEEKIKNLIKSLYKKYTVFELSQDILLLSLPI